MPVLAGVVGTLPRLLLYLCAQIKIVVLKMKRISLLVGCVVCLAVIPMLWSCSKSAVDRPQEKENIVEKKEKTEKESTPQKDEQGQTPPSNAGADDKKERQAPEQHEIIRRLSVRWKNNTNYQTQFDYYRLVQLKDNKFFTTQYLSKFVTFSVLPIAGGAEYILDAKDLEKLVITEISANQEKNTIELSYSYNGVSSTQKLSLAFDKTKYYTGQITQNREAIRTLYAAGVARNSQVFINRILSYDDSRYAVLSEGDGTLQSDDEVSFSIRILSKGDGDMVLATANVLVKGFKPIKELSKELHAEVANTDFNEFIRKHAQHKEYLRTAIPKKMTEQVKYYVKSGNERVELFYSSSSLAPAQGRLDIFLSEPRFIYKSIEEKSNGYDVVVTLGAGEPFFTHDFHIHVPKSGK
ncbi:hypothetical protein IX312_001745 [Porphyromonas levii]|nr:hypothetical protein [Porphyromonas levii]MBR8728415.1 hypothetical protein [Porphyromonas levii]MBR8736740.1 hypothetical protein [Porphyromonas levii]MBR8778809.1 hypothetical protein [Porphyromonas levii]MBR8783564.1 hypothetical protein [Porphyromonas levii]